MTKPFNGQALLEMINKLFEEKTNAYLKMIAEIEQAKQTTPVFRYQHPNNW